MPEPETFAVELLPAEARWLRALAEYDGYADPAAYLRALVVGALADQGQDGELLEDLGLDPLTPSEEVN